MVQSRPRGLGHGRRWAAARRRLPGAEGAGEGAGRRAEAPRGVPRRGPGGRLPPRGLPARLDPVADFARLPGELRSGFALAALAGSLRAAGARLARRPLATSRLQTGWSALARAGAAPPPR